MQDHRLIEELRFAFSKPVRNGVIELDTFLFDRRSFSILRLEDLYAETKGIIPPFRHTDYLLLFVKKGAGKRSIGQCSFSIQDNSIVVIPRRVIHTALYSSQPSGYLITFHPDFFVQQSFPYKLLHNKRILHPFHLPFKVVSEEQAAVVSSIFEKIMEECKSGLENKKQMIAIKMLELLILCERFFTEKKAYNNTVSYSDILRLFQELIEDNFTRHRDVKFYADALHTHPNHLNHLVKKVTGLTAKQTITNRLMMEARYLLVSTSQTIKEVAYALGFEDPNYFISFFKREQDATPLHYREQPV